MVVEAVVGAASVGNVGSRQGKGSWLIFEGALLSLIESCVFSCLICAWCAVHLAPCASISLYCVPFVAYLAALRIM